MLYSNIFSTLALLSLSAAAAVPGLKVLSLPLTKTTHDASHGEQLGKRDGDVESILKNQKTYYTTDITIGTPAQKVTILVDTGSSDLWVDSSVYDPSKSSTYKDNGNAFSITYGDGSSASGTFGTETIAFGGATVDAGNFAYATESNANGLYIFGVGYSTGEASATEYDNLPVQLKKQGFTESNSYSLWLNSYTDDEGSILFGGVDHARHDGELGLVPVVSVVEATADGGATRPDKLTRLTVNLNSIGLTNGDKTGKIVEGAAAPVLLDSGTTYGVLPQDWVEAIAASVGATYDDNIQTYTIPEIPSGTLDLDFSGIIINVPLESFIRPIYLTSGGTYQVDGKDVYTIAVEGQGTGVDLTSGEIYILGDGFLSGAYVAFDLDNNVIGLANAKTGDISDSNIEAIGSAGIPGTSAPGYSTATVSHTSYTLHTATGIVN